MTVSTISYKQMIADIVEALPTMQNVFSTQVYEGKLPSLRFLSEMLSEDLMHLIEVNELPAQFNFVPLKGWRFEISAETDVGSVFVESIEEHYCSSFGTCLLSMFYSLIVIGGATLVVIKKHDWERRCKALRRQ